MIRVGRFELDPLSRRAARLLAGTLFVPRDRRERWMLLLDEKLAALGLGVPPERLAPAAAVAPAPDRDAALAAIAAVLPDRPRALRAGPDLLPAPHVIGPLRVLVLWQGDDAAPFAVAKVSGDAAGAGRLRAEAEALRAVASLPDPIACHAPRLLASGESGGMAVLVQAMLPGMPLARLLALRRCGQWPAAAFTELGRRLGALHEAGRGHGDAWSRNVLADRRGGLGGWIDWEKSSTDFVPSAEALHVLLASARADLSARGPSWRQRAQDDEWLAAWTLDGGWQGEVSAAFLAAWCSRTPRSLRAWPDPVVPEALGLLRPPPPSLTRRLQRALDGGRNA